MIQTIKSGDRHHHNFGWLDTYWHFGFDTYHDPANTHWGALRVFNDDVIEPGRGFGMHPHRDMEIVTYVLSGALEHQDSMGNRGVVHPGEVQVMSAGSGVTHSEYNHSKTEPVRLIQLWIFPRARRETPLGAAAVQRCGAGRKAYLFVIEGAAEVNGLKLARGDQARIADEAELAIKATENSELILLDLPEGW